MAPLTAAIFGFLLTVIACGVWFLGAVIVSNTREILNEMRKRG